jgi:hypothetical protein
MDGLLTRAWKFESALNVLAETVDQCFKTAHLARAA